MYKRFMQTGLCSKEWHLKGRRPIITVKELNQCVEIHHESTGHAVTGKDISDLHNKSRSLDAKTHGIDATQL